MGIEDFEAALLFLLEGVLIGEELFEKGRGVVAIVGDGGIFVNDGDAIVPAAVFGCVIISLVQGAALGRGMIELYNILDAGPRILLVLGMGGFWLFGAVTLQVSIWVLSLTFIVFAVL